MTNDKLKCYLAPECREIIMHTRNLVCTSPMELGNSIDPFEDEIDYDTI